VQQKIAEILKKFVMFDREGKEMNFSESLIKLPNIEKLEIVFLAEKARSLIFGNSKAEGLSQKDIINFDIAPEGSVKATLKILIDTTKVKKNKLGTYYIPNYRLPEIYKKHRAEE